MRRGSRTLRSLALTAVVACFPARVHAQTLAVGDPLEDYVRVLQITGRADAGSYTVRPSAGEWAATGGHPWSARVGDGGPPGAEDFAWSWLDPQLRAFANSRFPLGRNDGPVWQGRGLSTALDVGATVQWRGLFLEARPTVLFMQNSSFELAPVLGAGLPRYAYPWRRIDLPQRFGPDPVWRLEPGESEVRLEARGATVGFGTKNLWWGPGIRNAIIMSNNAPGFPHAFLGTDGALDVGIGDLEGRWIWAGLSQSDWFDPAVTMTERFLTGIVLAYTPSFVDGLTLGLTRVFYMYSDEGLSAGDYFAVLRGVRKRGLATPENPSGEDLNDQLLSLFGRWVLPESGFEVYWEWARNDHSWEVRDFLLEPEHSQAYILGFRKAIELEGDRLLAIGTELTHLEADPTFQVREKGTYYQHGVVTQGYTHRGQIIGAGIGPGGNSQSLAATLYAPWGRAGTYLERQVHDNDAYYEWAAANGQTYCCHDVSFHLGADALVFRGNFDLGGGFIVTREYNRYFFGLDMWNLNLSLSARWRPD